MKTEQESSHETTVVRSRPDLRDGPPFSRRDWDAMDLYARKNWFDRVTKDHNIVHDLASRNALQHDETHVPCARKPRVIKPDYIAGFYCDCPMPSFVLGSGRTRYIVDPDDVFVSAVEYEDNGRRFRLSWKGYASRHYDGRLILYPVRTDAFAECSVLSKNGESYCENHIFGFCGANAVDCLCPGFLSFRPRELSDVDLEA